MKERGFCPNCNAEEVLERSSRTEVFDVKGQRIDVEVTILVCQKCHTDFYPADFDPNDLAFREYRKKLGWTQPDEIVQVRKRWGLTQNEFANLLGWGVATLSRYENGALQSESHESVLKLLKNDPLNLIQLLQDNSSLPLWRREEILTWLRPNKGEFIWNLFDKIYPKQTADEFSGFRQFDHTRLKDLILFFCKSGCLKTNLNKLLFYADFKAFKEKDSSLTGARYVRINYGPVVNDFNFYFASLVEDGSLEVEEIFYPNGYVGEKYTAKKEPDLSEFEQWERELLMLINMKLGGLNASDIADKSHKEMAHTQTAEKNFISYKWAKELSI